MRLTIAAIGRLKHGPERTLADDWLGRAGATGRAIGLGPFDVAEIDERKAAGREAQARRLLDTISAGATAVALDERGTTMSSAEFAALIARERDRGCPQMLFLIGGADGLGREVREVARYSLSFGPMVWPHMLARAMLAEQLYRATTILAGHPYHRA